MVVTRTARILFHLNATLRSKPVTVGSLVLDNLSDQLKR